MIYVFVYMITFCENIIYIINNKKIIVVIECANIYSEYT